MPPDTRARWKAALLGALLASLAPACSSEHPDALFGTETGNAPLWLDPTRITVTNEPDGAHIVGAPGAASPGGASIVVSANGVEVARTQARADGSFDLALGADADGTYSVRAELGSRQSSSTEVALSKSADGGSSSAKPSALSCDAQSAALVDELARLGAATDRSCSVDADCRYAELRADCAASCDALGYSIAGADALRQSLDALTLARCPTLAASGCNVELPTCQTVVGTLRCKDAECAYVEEPSAACDLPFDPGNGNGSSLVYWYDASTLTCLPRAFSGQGGNANRFATPDACAVSCFSPTICSKPDLGRTANNVCTLLDPKGACAIRQTVSCAHFCTSNEYCNGSTVGPVCNGDQVCAAAL
jgi:hypothetical protein